MSFLISKKFFLHMCESRYTLDFYKKALKKNAESHSSARITNKDKEYAVAFYAELFGNTSSSVRIFCEGAHSCVWKHLDFQNSFCEMVEKRGVTVRILTEESGDDMPDFPVYLRNILLDYPELVEIRHIEDESLKEIRDNFGGDVNFAIFDNDKFRFEYDKAHYAAYGSFNDPSVVGKLSDIFEKSFAKSFPMEIKRQSVYGNADLIDSVDSRPVPTDYKEYTGTV